MKKQPKPTINDLIKERNALLVSQDNQKRLDELNKKIDYINFGIIY